MATQAQDEALNLKRRARRRLVGAIALVLFLVIVPPLVMDLEPKPVSTTLKVEIPQQEGSPLALPSPAPAAQPETTPAAPPAEASAPQTSPSNEAAPHAEPTKEVDAETKRAEAILNQQGPYIIALATLSKKDNVKQLQSKLSRAGIKSYTEPVKTSAGEHTRVRAGPYDSKDAAEKARDKLQQLGLKPGPVINQ